MELFLTKTTLNTPSDMKMISISHLQAESVNISTWKIIANGSNRFFGCIQFRKVFFHISLQHVDVVLKYARHFSPMSEENHYVKLGD